jgi:adenine/guanine/hypoxanthine permease
MPFTYSIAYGLIAGIISYIVLNTIVWIVEKITGGRVKPAEKENKDPWTYKIEGGLLPPWLVRAGKGKRDFWKPSPEDDLEHHPTSGMVLDGADVRDGVKSAGQQVRDGSSSDEGSAGEQVKA